MAVGADMRANEGTDDKGSAEGTDDREAGEGTDDFLKDVGCEGAFQGLGISQHHWQFLTLQTKDHWPFIHTVASFWTW